MKNLFKNLFNTLVGSNPNSDIIRFIRTEFSNDTKHLQDDDALAYYNNYIKYRR